MAELNISNEIQNLYALCGVENNNKEINNKIMNREINSYLNDDFSAIYKNYEPNVYSASSVIPRKIHMV